MSNKSIDVNNLKSFIISLLPKYITNKDVLDKISYDQNAGTIKIDDNVIHLINDNIVSNQSTFSSDKIETMIASACKDILPALSTEEGVGGFRFNGTILQYYDNDTTQWKNIKLTTKDQQIVNVCPNAMKNVACKLDTASDTIKLKMTPPGDIIMQNQIICRINGVKIMRKTSSAPTGTDDSEAELVLDIKRSDFDKYTGDTWFDDPLGNFKDFKTYYYAFYPYSDAGFYNNASVNYCNQEYIMYNLFEFTLNQAESDPSHMITYGADNKNFTPAHMNYDTDQFNPGDWTVGNGAWFMDVKPCMLKYDGTVDYYLDPNDYSKKITGEPSDYNNLDYEGNVMIQIPKVYVKEILYEDDPNKVTYQISDKKLDDGFKCWAHLDNNGNEIDYCYMAAYEACNKNSKLRSISGVKPTGDLTAATETTYAKANNITDDVIWYTGVLCDRILIDKLLYLIGKSTDTQTVFGAGNISTESYASTTGVLNNKGLFYGTKTNNRNGVKVFGIEQYWGSLWNRIAGCLYNSNSYKIKLTYGQSDGSTVDGYNLDGNGYINTGVTCSGSSGTYIRHSVFNNQCIIPNATGASDSTYYCDGLLYYNNGYLFVGGCRDRGLLCGALYWNVSAAASYYDRRVGSMLSCKPLAF